MKLQTSHTQFKSECSWIIKQDKFTLSINIIDMLKFRMVSNNKT